MGMIVLPEHDKDLAGLQAAAHPVTRVYCDVDGIVCYERYGAEPILLDGLSPKESRKAALQRCVALMDDQPDDGLSRDMPISATGVGLTRNELKRQTVQACNRSKIVEAQRTDKMLAKAEKYKIKL
jgi:hypothetical protein